MMDRHNHAINKIYDSRSSSTGAILFGVFRGKVSEGIDFADASARCVVVIGIPYSKIDDPGVILKKYYLNKKK